MGNSGHNSYFNGVKASDTRILKSINILAVLKVLREVESVSRADIARITELTPATVSSIVSLLMKSGIARETGYGESTGAAPL